MKSLSIDTHPHDEACDRELYDLLTKEGQDLGESPGDEDESTVGVNPNQYPDPSGRRSSGIDAPHGENPEAHVGDHGLHFSHEVVRQFRQNREKLLDALFDGKRSSEGAEQRLVGAHLDHAASGNFETSAPMLRSKSDLQKVSMATLMERVQNLMGRY